MMTSSLHHQFLYDTDVGIVSIVPIFMLVGPTVLEELKHIDNYTRARMHARTHTHTHAHTHTHTHREREREREKERERERERTVFIVKISFALIIAEKT